MVIVKEAHAQTLLDSRGDDTISVTLTTDFGQFSASSPNGKSTGKYEAKSYKKDLLTDIATIKKFTSYFSNEVVETFDDLRRIEDILDGHVGANTLFAFESAVLKALAVKQQKAVWQLINPDATHFPRLVGNALGGGKHAKKTHNKKPDFQEFLFIPDEGSVKVNYERAVSLKDALRKLLEQKDDFFEGAMSDEKGWMTSLTDKQVLELFSTFDVPYGVDIAASSFFKRKKYRYNNPLMERTSDEQLQYLSNLLSNFSLFYVEDPFEENDFEHFAPLLEKFPETLLVGDDLTTTNLKRLEEAIKHNSINAIIIKPNQIGSLLEVRNVCTLARKHGIKLVFSHRSGETEETILADLAFGFQADFFKCGIAGDVRELKIKRLMEIESQL